MCNSEPSEWTKLLSARLILRRKAIISYARMEIPVQSNPADISFIYGSISRPYQNEVTLWFKVSLYINGYYLFGNAPCSYIKADDHRQNYMAYVNTEKSKINFRTLCGEQKPHEVRFDPIEYKT